MNHRTGFGSGFDTIGIVTPFLSLGVALRYTLAFLIHGRYILHCGAITCCRCLIIPFPRLCVVLRNASTVLVNRTKIVHSV